jgi:hypothetical protein
VSDFELYKSSEAYYAEYGGLTATSADGIDDDVQNEDVIRIASLSSIIIIFFE